MEKSDFEKSVVNDDICFKPYMFRYSISLRIMEMIACYYAGIKIVLYVVGDIYNQSVRYRAEHMVQVIEEIDEWYGLIMECSCLHYLDSFLDMIDIVIFHRVYHCDVCDFVTKLKDLGIPRYFDIDDYCFNMECLKTIGTDNIGKNRAHEISEYESLIKCCDGYITSTAYLQQQIAKYDSRPIYLLNNFMNKEESETAKQYLSADKIKNELSNYIIGYFCGMGMHDSDFSLVSSQLGFLLGNYPDILLLIGENLTLDHFLEQYERGGRIQRMGFMDGCSLLRAISCVDINLIPLADNRFAKARSEIKYFSAGVVGTETLMTDIPLYENLKRKYDYGVLCNSDNWIEKIDYHYRNRKKIDYSVKKAIFEDYCYSSQVKKISEFLNGVCKRK